MEKRLMMVIILVTGFFTVQAQQSSATVMINDHNRFQTVTGYGGFVCAPTFDYNYMTTAEIRKLWGKNSEMGYNIMRLYIPIGENNWAQSLATAQLAQSLGLIIFASPWSMPAEWKTNNSISGVVINGNNENEGFLKEEHYEDYANYLNGYVTYLKENGVELAGISLQNEPDYKVEYAGCTWTPQQIINFVNGYGDLIDCPIIAPETVGFSNNYINPILDSEAFGKIDIYAGHQYGNIQSDLQKVYETGKEIWMTEFLINWNAGSQTSRDYSWELDAFDFASHLNNAMLANVNAWVHYASKRYYAMMGDGVNGTTAGEITKRGYILSHYAKYTTGTTRIDAQWKDETSQLEGSSYISITGDSVILQVINPADEAYNLTVDLPFYTTSGTSIVTTDQVSMSDHVINIDDETFRPKVNVSASSFSTYIFIKSKERQASQMVGVPVYFNRIEEQTVTSNAFGTGFQLSDNTVTFDVNNQLISPNQNTNNGYLRLDEKYTEMIFHIRSASSANQYNSDNTTLYYVNADGNINSHNYGKIDIFPSGEFDWVFDISSAVLSDGCTGIIGISNSNYSSVLTLEFGDVFFQRGKEKSFKFSGIYSEDDSNLLDCLEDIRYTSLDFMEVEGTTGDQDWHADAVNKNCVCYVGEEVQNINLNVIAGTSCSQLSLTQSGGEFYVPKNFSAESATYTYTLDTYEMMVLPFGAKVPTDVKVFSLDPSATAINCTLMTDDNIPANTPILVVGNGNMAFEGSGSVSSAQPLVEGLAGVYSYKKIPAGGYYLGTKNGTVGFHLVDNNDVVVEPFRVYYSEDHSTAAASLPLIFPEEPDVTVTFEVNEGSAVQAMSAEFLRKITKPTNPTRDNHAFSGWYKDQELSSPWDFENDLAIEDMTLFAKWELANHTVSFETNGGSAIEAIGAIYQSTIEPPEVPSKLGYSFVGWFEDEELTDPWDFENDVVTADLTLYAKWELIMALHPETTLEVYPTLVTDVLYIGHESMKGLCFVYNMQGAQVMKKFPVSGATSLDVSALSQGLYLIKVVNKNRTVIGKFIKE